MTIRELADELQVSKVALNNRIAELDLKGELIKQGNKYIIPAEVAEQLRESFRTKRKTEPVQDKSNDVIQILSEQLQEKDRQIASLMRQLEQLQTQNSDFMKVIQQNNYLLADAMGATDREQNEPGEPITVTVSEDNARTETPAEPKKKSFFRRIFG